MQNLEEMAREYRKELEAKHWDRGYCDGAQSGFKAGHASAQGEIDELKSKIDELTSYRLYQEQKEEITRLKEIIERGEEIKNNWENNCYQEAVHYNWLDDQNAKLRDALGKAKDELEHAVKYLEASYVNVEDCEPEVQMCNGFKKALTAIDKALGENNAGS